MTINIIDKSYLKKLTDMLSLILGSFSHAIQAGLVSLVITVTEVESSNVHTGIDEGLDGGDIPTGGSHGTDNLGLAVRHIRRGCDSGKSDVGTTEFGAGSG